MNASPSDFLAAANRLIRNRRSIKPALMDDRPIEPALLDAILENANWAPTHGLTEPWRFRIYHGDARQRLAAALQRIYQSTTAKADYRPEKYEKLGRSPRQAGVTMVLWMRRQAKGKIPEVEEIEATACAVQNMHLTAAAAGLGAFWSSPPLVYTEAMRDWLGIGPDDRCLGLFYLGWPKKDAPLPDGRRGPVAEKVEWVDG